jgi:hypothetical protein
VFRLLFAISLVSPTTLLAAGVDFDRDIRPILADNCYPCHGPDANARKAKLRLDRTEGVFRTRRGKTVVVPGDSVASVLIQRVSAEDPDDRMPPSDFGLKLTKDEVERLRQWIDDGAEWGEHWAFRRPERPALPDVKDAEWSRQPIDRFILARLELEGLSPSQAASRTTLIRRVALDLTGLPPSLEEVDAFLEDDSSGAYEKLVDRLLASPRFGERMIWEWLDAARYADSNGYQGDRERTMWPWRDWAVNAINDDLPFDEFTVEQLAGDLLPSPTHEQRLATGFNRNHMINGEGGRIPEENRIEYVFDQTETTAVVWLGATIGCARCHDHKFDPFTQREYYQFFAFFNNTPVNGGGGDPQMAPAISYESPQTKREFARIQREVDSLYGQLAEIEAKIFVRSSGQPVSESDLAKKLDKKTRELLARKLSDRNNGQLGALAKSFEKTHTDYAGKLSLLKKAFESRERLRKSLPRVMVMEERAKVRETAILTRGLYNKPGEKVSAGVPAVLPPLPKDVPVNRLALARWLVDPSQPLTSRVTIDRIWQQVFGVGIVKTVGDFGVQGEKPSHPALLDWLATEFVASGWNVKRMLRMIVTSSTYRQTSRVTAQSLERDPKNRLLSRAPRYRLPSFMIRDQALAASGLLVTKLGGPPVHPYQPSGVWAEATFGKKRYRQGKGESLHRRSVYTFWRRIIGPTIFFDSATRQICTVQASRTNTPLHALSTLNDVTYTEAARVLAQRVMHRTSSQEERIELAFRLLTARRPAAAESEILGARLDALRREFAAHPDEAKKLLSQGEAPRDEKLDAVEHAAYATLCSLLLNLDEVLSKE